MTSSSGVGDRGRRSLLEEELRGPRGFFRRNLIRDSKVDFEDPTIKKPITEPDVIEIN